MQAVSASLLGFQTLFQATADERSFQKRGLQLQRDTPVAFRIRGLCDDERLPVLEDH